MGGNCLKNCVTRRYEADEYENLAFNVRIKLATMFPEVSVHVHPIDAYHNKKSFGDLDILLACGNLPGDWVERIVEEFKPKEWVKNSNVLSFEYKEFQVDVITCPMKEFETSKRYYAFNDLGNLLGRISHAMNLKLGHDGLSFNWRIDTYQFKNEIISTDWEEICNVLGVSYERYCQGFDELEDIFEFVMASPFFHADIYLLENRNNASRVRDRKRKTYTTFLEYIKDYQHTEMQVLNKVIRDTQSKDYWLQRQFRTIKGFEATYKRVQQEWADEVEYKSRYNGDVVKELTGLDGKELGEFMKYMRNTHTAEGIRKSVMTVNKEVVPHWIKLAYYVYKGD